jgi:hypothetical protein
MIFPDPDPANKSFGADRIRFRIRIHQVKEYITPLQEQALHRELREKREQLEQLMKKNVFRSAD